MQKFAVLSLLANANAMTFESFMKLHNRSYEKGSEEYGMRLALYQQRRAAVEAHNAKPQRLWTAGINKLSDRTESELQALRGWDGSVRPTSSGRGSGRAVRPHSAFLQQEDEDDLADLPKEKLWLDIAAARDIRDQGDCGSCWAVAAATVLEAHAEIYGHARTFSAQQIVECTPNPRSCGGNGGCGGATAELAMDWVMKNTVAQEDELPYTGQDAKCKSVLDSNPSLAMAQLFGAPSSAAGFGMTGWETLPKNSYEPLVRALAQKGPVAVSVAADSWFNYESGIFNGCDKDAVIDHAVTAIGYGQEVDTKYWVIQNSWGSDWGEAGHIRLERHPDGQYCGMNNDPQKGVACQGENDPVPVCGMCGVLFDSVVPHFQK
jgi:cathepsin L